MNFKDYFSGHAASYKTFRPTYPLELFDYLATLAPSRRQAWDCACGNGQAAVTLRASFDHVIATDASQTQIAEAEAAPGIEYLVAPAEQTPIASGSIDLVTVAQALHWFDRPAFYAEVRRVARPEAALAVWCYELLTASPAIDAAIYRLYESILGSYWPPERKLVESGYATIDFPFAEIACPTFVMQKHWKLEQLVGYLCTWSSVKRYEQQLGSNPLSLVWDELLAAWGDPAEVRLMSWPLHLRVGRV